MHVNGQHERLRYSIWGVVSLAWALASCGTEPDPVALTTAALVAAESDFACHAAATPDDCVEHSHGGHTYLRCDPEERGRRGRLRRIRAEDAAERCAAWGGHLAQIQSADENAMLVSLADEGDALGYLVGARRDGDVWRWPDEAAFWEHRGGAIDGAFADWRGSGPRSSRDEVAWIYRGEWRPARDQRLTWGYLCESPAPACGVETCDDVSDDDGDGDVDCRDESCASCEAQELSCDDERDDDGDGAADCDDADCAGDAACPVMCPRAADASEVGSDDGRYVLGSARGWLEARDSCRERGYVLASPTRGSDRRAILRLLDDLVDEEPHAEGLGVWIGVNDRAEEGSPRGADGTEPDRTRWGSREPRADSADQDCAYLDERRRWRMARCFTRRPYVCERAAPLCTTPVIEVGPSSQSVTEGDDVSFQVDASGGALRYRWQRDGADIPGADSDTLALRDVTVADDGARFRVVVTNDVGSATSAEAVLSVRPAPPTIASSPSDVDAYEGSTATFTVAALGTALRYQWQRDDVALVGETSATLAVGPLTAADDGASFRVVVSNDGGAVTSAAAMLRVLAVPRVTRDPISITVAEGASATFDAEVSGADLSFQWHRDGVAIPGATGPAYTLPSASLRDDGAVFDLVVDNPGGSATSAGATLRVERAAPVILSGLSDRSVEEGAAAAFEVVASGLGLSYVWERDSVVVAGATGPRLELPAVALSDDGARFRVTVANAGGSVSSEATLHVTPSPPTILSEPADQSALEGAVASFAVSASGSGLAYQWQRDGAAIIGETGPRLDVDPVLAADDGATFRVVVTNVSGSVTSRAATLHVTLRAPTLVSSPADASVREGDAASFSVVASGTGLGYEWRRDGVVIPGATGATLSLGSVGLSDDGAVFRVRVFNASGSVSSDPATLRVTHRAPTIVSQPASVTVLEGTDATFAVGATGSDLSFQWRRDGVAIAGASSATYTAVARYEDRGAAFSVVVSNPGGSVTSADAILGLTLAPPRIVSDPADVSVAEGESATFRVVASGSELTYRWRRDGELVGGVSGAELTVASAALSDHGARFQAEVINAAGAVVSALATLSVTQLPPRIVSGPVDVAVVEGRPASFVVSALGSGLRYAWERDGAPIPGADASTYTLDPAALADDGARFRVIVSNDAGSTSSPEATLSVALAAPVIAVHPADARVDEGAAATFSVTATGSLLRYRWERDGAPVPGATGATLALPAVAYADRGARFVAFVANDAGEVASSAATLSVTLLPPVIAVGPADQTVSEGALATFSVEARGSELSYTWLVDGAPLAGVTGAVLTYGPVLVEQDGSSIAVRVRNAAGEVVSSAATLRVTPLAPAIVSQPESLTVDEGASATFAVLAERADSYQWRRDGVELPGEVGASLTLTSVVAADDGASFDVAVRNASGEVLSAPATLTVRIAPPAILTQPADSVVVEGDEARFWVVASGSGLSYQWRRDAVELAGATGSELVLPVAALADDGALYDVVVHNGAGAVTSRAATLRVTLAPPTIDVQPADQLVTEGTPAHFSVVARGSSLSYQWRRDGVAIAGANAATFTLAAAALSDRDARFSVVVSNAAGSVTSREAVLDVDVALPVVVTSPVDLSVDEGADALFTVGATGSELAYQWRRDGSPLAGQTAPTLALRGVTLADHLAVFDVVVSNAAGAVTSAAATLSVRQVAPRITTPPAPRTVHDGEPALFSVVAVGSGLRYQWQRDGVDVAGATGASFTLASAAPSDDGAVFRAVVSNDAGAVTSAGAALTVVPAAPVIVRAPDDQSALEGGSATFEVEASGRSLSYQWRRDGAPVPGATAASITLTALTLADDGATFDVVVSNVTATVTSASATLTVALAPPRVSAQPESLTVDEGAPASFAVVASGSALSYQWQRDGLDVPGATSAEHHLAAATAADDGASFTVVVSNAAGSVSSTPALLSVRLAAPTITTPPASVAVEDGETATFSVVASGSALSYQWQRGGVAIAGATSASYSLVAAPADDGASFRVVVSNSGGAVTSAAATLNVAPAAPVILTGLVDASVEEGQAASFEVVAGGRDLSYRWERDGVSLAGALSPRLEIPGVALSDDGARFRVVVTNATGEASSEATLHVRPRAPIIVSQPSDQSATEAGSATFSVGATGVGLSYRWQRDGVAISGATASSYALDPVAVSDDGAAFTVVVSNVSGSVTSRAATLSVTPLPPRIVSQPASVSVLEGDPAAFTVVAAGAALRYEWRRDGEPIPGATAATLSLASVSLADDGALFRCVVSNDSGSVSSDAASLTVGRRAPRIITQPSSVSVLEGAEATFTVVAEGTGLSYQWRRAGAAIAGATGASFSLTTTYADDGARFSVVVSNDAGSVTSDAAALSVALAAPSIVSEPSDASVTEGEPATFRVVASGSLLSYRWLRDGAALPGETGAELTLPAVTLSDQGASFSVEVDNAAGVVTSRAALLTVVQRAPEITTQPLGLSVVEGSPAEFAVVASGSGLSYRWQRDGVDIPAATADTYRIDSASVADDGASFRVIVTNAAGSVTSAAALLRVGAALPVIVTDPADVTTDEGASALFRVVATGTDLTYRWERDGVPLGGETTDTLVLPVVRWEDRGALFVAFVANAAGEVASSAATLSVRLAAPVLVRAPEDQTVSEGELASFSVEATGSELSYEWRVDGVVVAGVSTPTLELGPLLPDSDGAQVTVRVFNAAGELTAGPATLSVTALAPTITLQPESQTVNEGEAATYAVTAMRATSYQWRRDGVDMAAETSAELFLGSVSAADDGAAFDVVVTNAAGSVVSSVATLTVRLNPPTIATEPIDVSVTEGDPVGFSVVALGSALTYQWRRDGVEIPGATGDSYSLATAQLADDGSVFDVVVTNSGGAATSRAAALSVAHALPVIVTQPSDVSVVEGSAAMFSVAASGSTLSYQWARDGADIPGATSNAYTLTPATRADDGATFAVTVTNPAGSVTSSVAALAVALAPPVITAAPESVTVDEGASASFSVVASGSELAYQWRRDGADLVGETAASLSLASVAITDTGASFDVVVSNAAGTVTSAAATLTVRRLPPVITTQPASLTVHDDEDATFTVVAAGTGLRYQWRRAGAAIVGATGPAYTLVGARPSDDAATFSVDVDNDAGSVTSATATLTVVPAAPVILGGPDPAVVIEGESASFTVVTSGRDVTYQWRRGGAPIAGANAATYTLASAARADDGATFDVVVTNVTGTVTSAAATLSVALAPPRVVTGPESIAVDEGSSAAFAVVGAGSELRYRWQRDGVDVPGAESATYTLAAAAAGDDGASFVAFVENDAGSVSSAPATLTVRLLPPTITTQPVAMTVDEGGPASFSVVATGTALTYQWQHAGAPIPGATSSSFAIAAAAVTDEGEYRVVVRNAGGEVTSDAVALTVRVAAPIIVTQPVSQTVTEGTPVTLSVDATGTALSYQWFKDGAPVSGATSRTLSFGSSARADSGAYRVDVSNAGGVTPSAEAVLTVRMPPPVIVTQPEDVEVALGEGVTFTVAATGESLSYQWQRFGADVAGATSSTYSFSAAEADDGVPYHVVVTNAGGAVVSRDATLRLRDSTAPTLTLTSSASITTMDSAIVIEGVATDEGGGDVTVRATSDRFAAMPFGASADPTGRFSIDVPIEVGANAIEVVATDAAGNESAPRSVSVTRELPLIPRITIVSPAPGTVTDAESVTVTGSVLTSLPADALRMELGDLVEIPTGSDGHYTFRFDRVPLVLGTNVLTVVARSSLGAVSAETSVVRSSEPGDGGTGGPSGPVITVAGVREDTWYTSDPIALAGTVRASSCVAGVTVNGVAVALRARGTSASFDASVPFGGASELPITIVATDCGGLSSSITYTAHLDDGAPEISFDRLLDSPAVNPALENPYRITGTITDGSLAGVAVEGMSLGLLPTAVADQWSFAVDVALARGEVRTYRVAAWDRAGNRTETEVLIRLDATVDLAMVAPAPGERVFGSGATSDLRVAARITGASAGDTIEASLNGGDVVPMSRTGTLAETHIPGVATGTTHTIVVRARSSAGDVIAEATSSFEHVDRESLPLEVVSVAPANGADNVETNAFVSIRFNRPIDPARLSLTLLETVHGLQYPEPEDGIDLREMSVVELAEVNRDREEISGNLTILPGNMSAIFYPSRDLAYGGQLYVEIDYDGATVSRSDFQVRPLPTLLHGFVADHDLNPLEGIVVSFPTLGLTAETNEDGLWDMGFGWTADRQLPAGFHRAVVNPGLHDPRYGTIEVRVLVRAGENNEAGIARLPFLDSSEPFRRLVSGDPSASLARGDLRVDLTSAELVFSTGASEGDVHVQMMRGNDLGYPAEWPVEFGFVTQPGGVQVRGAVGLDVALPLSRGTRDYADELGARCLVFALDPSSLRLVVVGVTRVDAAAARLRTHTPVSVERFDFIGFGFVPPELQAALAEFEAGTRSLVELRSALQERP